MYKNSKKTPFGQITINFGKYPVSKHVKKHQKTSKMGFLNKLFLAWHRVNHVFRHSIYVKLHYFKVFGQNLKKPLYGERRNYLSFLKGPVLKMTKNGFLKVLIPQVVHFY